MPWFFMLTVADKDVIAICVLKHAAMLGKL
jgi:hypothetical protein